MLRLALASLVLVLSACDATDTGEVDTARLSHDGASLVGTWDLIFVTSSGESLTPVTRSAVEAGTETYAFSDDGTATITRSGQPTIEVPYTVRRLDYDNGTQSDVPYLLFDEQIQTRFGIDGDVLYLDGREVDGELREYARR